MKQKLKRFMAGFMAMLTLVGTLFTNGTTAFAASPQANIAFWNASVKNSGEVSELKPGYNHGKILYSILDGNSAYCMNFGLRADGGQLMNSYDDASTSMSAQQRKLLSYCLYYGFNSTQKAAPSNSQCDEYIATQAMVWVIVADIFGTGSGDSAARKLCNTAPSPDSSYSYYERLRDNISSSYNATLPSFASRRTSEAPTYELKWNEGSQRFETTLSDSNGVLSDFDFGISGYSVDKNGNSITISSMSVNTTATTGTFTSNAGKIETTSSCVFWLTGKSGYQEFISERPTADPIKAYIKVKTENIGYGELTKTDESSGVKLSGAVYGIYSDSGCTNRIQIMTTDGNGYAKSAALVAGTYYVKEITAPKGYVLSGKVHTLTVKAGQTTGISATDKEQLGAITIYKEGEVLSSWNGSNFTYEKKKLSGATFMVTAGADIYKADGTKVYSAGDVVAESLTTGTDGQVVLSDLHLGTYVVTEIKSIDGYTINTTPQTVAVEYKDQTVTVQYESTTIENTRQKADVSVVKKDSDTENFETVLKLLGEAEVTEQGKASKLDVRMKFLEESSPLGANHPAVKQYNKCMRGAGDTVRSIIISANSRLAFLENKQVLRLLSKDELNLSDIGIGVNGDGETKTALFCVIPDSDKSYNFIIGMLYTQIFQELYYQADFNCGGRLPIHVTFMLDEFANVALPDDFCSLLSTMRSREISSIIIIQNFAQLKALFKDTWETIPGNCDTFIYLGGNEQSTHKYVSELLGKGTIDKKSSGETKGRQGSSSRNYDVLGRELFTPDEVRKLDNKKCIIFIRGFDPIMDNKFIPFNHPMFNQTADGKGEPYVHQIRGADNLIGPPFEILSDKAVKYYEKLKDKGENVYIDTLTYEQFMMLGDAELSRRFSMQDEAEQKAKIDREQANELEYVDESQKSDASESANASSGSAGAKPVRNPEREKPKWEDTITNRMLHWSYTPEQKEEVKKALAAGVPKATILTYFYPEVTVEKMSSYRKKQ